MAVRGLVLRVRLSNVKTGPIALGLGWQQPKVPRYRIVEAGVEFHMTFILTSSICRYTPLSLRYVTFNNQISWKTFPS